MGLLEGKKLDDLKPCPFCNRQPHISVLFGRIVIECIDGDCNIQPSTFLTTNSTNMRKTMVAWNNRGE